MAHVVTWMIFLPLIGAVVCLLVSHAASKWVALLTTIVTAALSVLLAFNFYNGESDAQFVLAVDWISGINVQYRTGVDGLNMPLVLLTTLLSILVVMASWSIEKATKAYMALYLFLITGMLGVFLSLDLFLFYVFFEISLLPMYFLIGVWGGPRKEYAAIKFFLYTLFGSICLLIVMLGLFFFTKEAAGANGSTWIMAGAGEGELSLIDPAVRALFASGGPHWEFAQLAFWLTLIAFMVKLPAVPFHTWLPDAHVEAPTPISMVLAGVLLKMGGYAMMRITWPFFAEAAQLFWACAAGLGVIAIIYGAFCAMAQTDWKRLVAYSSVSHMGYVMLGIAVLNKTAFDGAYYQMIAHGISSAMMFYLVGVVYERSHHRDLNRLGGIWNKWPGYTGWAMLGFFAGMGLPGLCGFIGEIMVLLGTFKAAGAGQIGAGDVATVYTLGILAASGVILTAGYILWMVQRVYMGKPREDYEGYENIRPIEYGVMLPLGVAAIVFGVVPALVFNMTDATFTDLLEIIAPASDAVMAATDN